MEANIIIGRLNQRENVEQSKFQIASGELRVDLAPAGAYVFEIDTPNIEKDRKGNVFKQKVSD